MKYEMVKYGKKRREIKKSSVELPGAGSNQKQQKG